MSPEYIQELLLWFAVLGVNCMMFAVVCEAIDKKGEKILHKILKKVRN